jgi:hypothetical protein
VRRLLAALALGAVLASCGGDARALSAIDLAAVKERLDLPEGIAPGLERGATVGAMDCG